MSRSSSRAVPLAVALFSLVSARSGAAHAQSRDGEGAPDSTTNDPPPGGREAAIPDLIQPSPPQPGPRQTSATSPWSLVVYGYLRAGYDRTTPDERFEFVGRNNGFVLDSARVGVEGRNRDHGVTFRVSTEGASDVLSAPNTPIGSLSVRLRDAFVRWDPIRWLGVQAGQYKAPFQEEELRGTPDLMFASRAVGVEGVPPARGFQTPGIQLDRQLGVMLSPAEPIGGDLGIAYYLMVMNGNGPNQLLDDNGRFGLVARSEIGWQKHVRLGAALFRNDRTVGAPPNLYHEEDLGLTGDLSIKLAGLEVFGAVTRARTVFPTVGASARVQLAFQGQAAYRVELPSLFFAPAYRYAYFHPWQEGGATEGFDSFRLVYHTIGVRLGMTALPIQAWLNYTIATEAEGRELDNDRVELLGQVTF